MPRAERAPHPEPENPGRGRILALAVPLFPLAALIRSEPDIAERAVVVVEGDGTVSRVVAATRPARRAGIRPGMTPAQARSLLPSLLARYRDRTAETAAREALLEAVGSISPKVEDGGAGLVLADLAGLHRLFPSEADTAHEAVMAAERLGLPTRAGVAGSRLVARIAAGLPESPVVVAPGDERAFLAPLPLERLQPSPSVLHRLHQWGISTMGGLARLSEGEVAARLGAEGVALHRAVRGVDPRPLVPTPPPPTLLEGLTLDWPASRLEPFLVAVRECLERLALRLEARGTGCRQLDLDLTLEPDGRQRRRLRLPSPSADPDTLLDLVGLELERRPPGAPVAAFTLLAHPLPKRSAQLSLFGPEELSPEEVGGAMARIAARLGEEHIGSPRPVDTYLPAARELAVFEPPPPPRFATAPEPAPGHLAVRALQPPRPVEVIVDEPSGRLVSLATPPGTQPRLQGLIRTTAGPWPLDTAWWDEQEDDAVEDHPGGVTRAFMDVELSGGELLRIFRTPSGDWYVDGIYD